MNKKYILLFLSGGISSLSFTPVFFPLFLIIGFYVLLKNIQSSNIIRDNFLLSFSFGFGYFLIGMHWIFYPLTFDERFHYFIPLLVTFFSMFFSLFFCFPACLCTIYLRRFKPNFFLKTFSIALIFYLAELIRSTIFGGFPWNLFSHIWANNEKFIVISKYIGAFGLSFLTIFWVTLVSQYAIIRKYKNFFLSLILFPTFLFLIGSISKSQQSAEKIKVRLVQPNISQKIKWSKKYFEENINNLISLSLDNINESDPPKLIIWPEVAVPIFLNEKKRLINSISNILPQQTILVLGSLRKEGDDEIFNSLYMISKNGIQGFYDKIRLVPFGEFMPFRNLFGLKKLTHGSTDFSPGKKRKILNIKTHERIISFEPSICYEGIFPNKKINEAKVDFLINITNDAWFGNTTGPHQHIMASKFRSIERGIPLIRVANTGISAIFDNNGKLIKSLSLNQRGFIDSEVSLTNADTIFSKLGHLTIIILISFFLAGCSFLDFLVKKRLKN